MASLQKRKDDGIPADIWLFMWDPYTIIVPWICKKTKNIWIDRLMIISFKTNRLVSLNLILKLFYLQIAYWSTEICHVKLLVLTARAFSPWRISSKLKLEHISDHILPPVENKREKDIIKVESKALFTTKCRHAYFIQCNCIIVSYFIINLSSINLWPAVNTPTLPYSQFFKLLSYPS